MPTLSFSEHRNGLPEKSASTTARYGTRFEQKSGLVCRVVSSRRSRFQFQFGSRPRRFSHDAAFLGTMYRKRAEYIGNVGYPIVHIQSVSSSNVRTSFDLLVDAYCSTKIFVNLPGLSRLLVRKITKVMACGTFPLTSSSRSSFGLSQHGAVRASQASRLLRPR